MILRGRRSGYILSLLIGLTAILLILPASPLVPEEIEGVPAGSIENGYLYYSIDTDNRTAVVTGSVSEGSEDYPVEIPPTFFHGTEIYNVVSVADGAFIGETGLTSVKILGNISIGDQAFAGCTSLVSIELPNDVSVMPSMFENCVKLTSVIFSGDAIDYEKIINDFPNTISSIALMNGSSVDLNSITSVNRITKIGIMNSSEDPIIGDLIFKNSDETIIENASELKGKFFAANTRTEWIQIATMMPSDSNVKYEINKTDLTAKVTGLKNEWSINVKIDGHIVRDGIVYEVISIGNLAFSSCLSLTSISVPDNIISIGNYAFLNCTSLTSITLPDNLTTVNNNAFLGCSKLIYITVPKNVTSIGNGTFASCTSLTTVNLPEGITTIGESAFYGCSSLTEIILPNGLISLDVNSFYGTGLTSVALPGSLEACGTGAFSQCSSLTDIFVNEANALFKDVNGVLYSIDGTVLAQYPCGRIGPFIIPEGVEIVEKYAFGFSNLSSVTIPGSVAVLDVYAFSDCASLTSLIMPDRINSMDPTAFHNNNISSLTIRGNASSNVTDYSELLMH
ncbi:MAG: leucine-rich repeat protein, partial [Thermoplasmatales archaeon]|nr:leucine-rich repeat protein [Thermoplasmatales archaeon]